MELKKKSSKKGEWRFAVGERLLMNPSGWYWNRRIARRSFMIAMIAVVLLSFHFSAPFICFLLP